MVPLRAHANHVVEVRVVISDACSRWFRRCAHYRPAGEVVDVSRYEVALHARHAPHPGCLKYALPFDARVRRALPASKPFPKVSRPRCVALAWRCA